MTVIALLEAAGVECYSRGEWGTVRPAAYEKRRSTHPMPDGPAPYHFLHITVTPDTDTVLEGKAGARKVESYGLSTPPMMSYQALVSNEGKWFEGQNYGTKGTHTINDKNVAGFPHDLNRYGYAVAIMQNVGDAVTDIQVRVIALTFAAAELAGFVKRGAQIYPHRKFDWKECPGDKAVARLSEIQRLKDYYVKNGLPKATPQESDDVISTAQMTELKNHITREVRRFSIWELRWLTQTEDERIEARAKYDAAIAAGKTPDQAAALVIAELAPLDDSLEETQKG